MTYISPERRREWREDAEQRATRADAHLVFAQRIIALLDQAEAPCGSCHPCTEWANQTWVNAGERLPHVHEWQELKAEAATAYERGRAEVTAAVEAVLDKTAGNGGYVITGMVRAALADPAAHVAAIRAEAWDEGYRSGLSNAMRRMSDEPDAPTTPNPYRIGGEPRA